MQSWQEGLVKRRGGVFFIRRTLCNSNPGAMCTLSSSRQETLHLAAKVEDEHSRTGVWSWAQKNALWRLDNCGKRLVSHGIILHHTKNIVKVTLSSPSKRFTSRNNSASTCRNATITQVYGDGLTQLERFPSIQDTIFTRAKVHNEF